MTLVDFYNPLDIPVGAELAEGEADGAKVLHIKDYGPVVRIIAKNGSDTYCVTRKRNSVVGVHR